MNRNGVMQLVAQIESLSVEIASACDDFSERSADIPVRSNPPSFDRYKYSNRRPKFLPLPGERVGVRASVHTRFLLWLGLCRRLVLRGVAQRLCSFAALFCCLSASAQTSPTPFLNHRARTLEYPGSDIEFTNLTEIRIGWFGPHESTNGWGADMWWAASVAIQEANEQGGYHGLPFRLIPRWAVNPWGTGVSHLTRMVYDEQPLAVLGSVDSATTHLAEQVVAKANLPLVSPVSTDQSVTLAGVSWMFSCAPSDAAIARVLVKELLAVAGGGTNGFALLTTTEHESRMTAREVLRECSRCGRLPSFRFEAQPGATAIERQVSALAESLPHAVLIIASPEDSARLAVAVRARLPETLIFGSHSMGRAAFLHLAGQAAEGVRFPLLFSPSKDPVRVQLLQERFLAEHHRPADYVALLTYDSTRLLVEAIRTAGPSRAHIRQALHQLSPWQGIAGTISFDGTGQNMRSDVSLATIENGKIVPLRKPDVLQAGR